MLSVSYGRIMGVLVSKEHNSPTELAWIYRDYCFFHQYRKCICYLTGQYVSIWKCNLRYNLEHSWVLFYNDIISRKQNTSIIFQKIDMCLFCFAKYWKLHCSKQCHVKYEFLNLEKIRFVSATTHNNKNGEFHRHLCVIAMKDIASKLKKIQYACAYPLEMWLFSTKCLCAIPFFLGFCLFRDWN